MGVHLVFCVWPPRYHNGQHPAQWLVLNRVVRRIFFNWLSIIYFILPVTTEMFPFAMAKVIRVLVIQHSACFYNVLMVDGFGGGWIDTADGWNRKR